MRKDSKAYARQEFQNGQKSTMPQRCGTRKITGIIYDKRRLAGDSIFAYFFR